MKIKLLRNDINVPIKGTEYSAGIDVHCNEDTTLLPKQTLRFPLGIAIEINSDECVMMSERSSMGKKGITSVGNIIDSDYRGEISIVLQNNSDDEHIFTKNDRIGQMIVLKCGDNSINITDTLSDTERGDGGFGSTGK